LFFVYGYSSRLGRRLWLDLSRDLRWLIVDVFPVCFVLDYGFRLLYWLLFCLWNWNFSRLLDLSFGGWFGLLDHNNNEVSIFNPVRSDWVLSFA
jgi:hypothetical protein